LEHVRFKYVEIQFFCSVLYVYGNDVFLLIENIFDNVMFSLAV